MIDVVLDPTPASRLLEQPVPQSPLRGRLTGTRGGWKARANHYRPMQVIDVDDRCRPRLHDGMLDTSLRCPRGGWTAHAGRFRTSRFMEEPRRAPRPKVACHAAEECRRGDSKPAPRAGPNLVARLGRVTVARGVAACNPPVRENRGVPRDRRSRATPRFEADRGRFELPIQVTPYTAFPMLLLQPLGHLSRRGAEYSETVPKGASSIQVRDLSVFSHSVRCRSHSHTGTAPRGSGRANSVRVPAAALDSAVKYPANPK